MDAGHSHDRMILDLAAELKPVRRLWPATVRAFVWLAVVVAVALPLAWLADLPALRDRLTEAPDMWLAVAGSTLTAVFAAVAAFQLSLPDAPRGFALLPLPPALLWLGASGFGCLRPWIVPETHVAVSIEARDCLVFILALSLPLSVLLFAMLRRACPLQPSLTAVTAGLASAAAAATLLNFFHPFDAAFTDLAMHVVAVAIVIAANRALGGWLLASPRAAPTSLVAKGQVTGGAAPSK
jgi:hypothetical protein